MVSATALGEALAQLEALQHAPWVSRALTERAGFSLEELYATVVHYVQTQNRARYSYARKGWVAGVFFNTGWKFFTEGSGDASDKRRLEDFVGRVFGAIPSTKPSDWHSLPKVEVSLT
jgi:hypothetical protein